MHPNTKLQQLMDECSRAYSFRDLADVAIRELMKFDGAAEFVCGPITSGGIIKSGVVDAFANRQVLGATIAKLKGEGRLVFNQMAYELRINQLRELWQAEDPLVRKNAYCEPILDEFYEPLLYTGRIFVGHFIYGWENSHGARREHDILKRLGKRVEYIDRSYLNGIPKAG